MAVVTVNSTSIANAVATPKVLNTPNVYRGKIRESQDQVAIANGDSIASIYRMCRVSSGARVASLKVFCDAITSAAADIGLYDVNGGAVVAVHQFATGQTLAAANKTGIDVTFSNTTLANANKRVWELLGLSSDPNKEYDIALTLSAAATAAGNVLMRLSAVSGD